MVAFLSVIGICSGGGLACAATHRPARAAALERWGGLLLMAGLALLGAGLQSSHG